MARKQKYANWGAKDPYLATDVVVKIASAPIGGWDAISPLSVMEPKYAVNLINWVPRTGWCEIRGGYNAWTQGLGSSVQSLMAYRPNTGLERLFAASGTTIYEVSSYGVFTSSLTGLSNSRFQKVMFTPGGASVNYMIIVNGSDPCKEFNGTAWSEPTITGVSSSTFVHVNVFKRRVWFTQANSTSVWYLPTDAIQGAATQLDLGPFMSKGGYLVAMATWTVDGGQGPDDLAVFISSKGQVILYKGTDPTNANAWAMVGVFDMAPPIGRRCFMRFGADVILITSQGALPLSQALPFDPVASRSVALTNRIQNAMLNAAQMYSDNFGWEMISFAQQSLVFMNIPQVQGQTQVQYVMNSITGAWCQFTGWNANCFEIYNESLYFGDNSGNVNLAYTGGLDLITPIPADMKCAFNYFDEPGRLKNANLIRPFIVADGTITPTIQIDVDFGDTSLAAPVTTLTPNGAIWDTSLWDNSIWATGSAPVINWLSCNALGTALAIRLLVNLAGGGTSGSVSQSSVFDTGVFDTMVFDGNGSIIQSGTGIPVMQVNVFEIALEYGGPV